MCKVIHIAGTNGKGSTAKFITDMLVHNGYSVVSFISPHIISPTDRVQYNGIPISNDDYERLYSTYVKCKSLSLFTTTFQMCMGLVFESNPDFLILETGIGGYFDLTNEINAVNKIAVITSISKDHEELLTSDIRMIVRHKLGIVKNTTKPVFIGYNSPEVLNLIQENITKNEAVFLPDVPEEVMMLYDKPFAYNYLLAKQVVEYVIGEQMPHIQYKLPACRQERIGNIMLDGAHNIGALESLADSLQSQHFDNVIISCTKERNINDFINIVEKRISADITLTTIPNESRSISEQTLISTGYTICIDPIKALNNMSGNVLVTGSLKLCSYVRNQILTEEIK